MILPMIEKTANIEARTNLIRRMTANTDNPKARNVIERKSFGNARIRTRHIHRQVNMIIPMKVTTNVRYTIRRRAIRKRTL